MSMARPRIFVDTAGWYALVDANDQHHDRAKEWFDQSDGFLITTDYVFDEIVTLIRQKLGHDRAVTFGQKLHESSRTRLRNVQQQDRDSAWELFQTYDDEQFSFTDCTSFAVMEQEGTERVFTFDHDFAIAGYHTLPRSGPNTE